jgi:Tfp pilus assembly protein, tip-associated adhesin PilY1
MPKRLFHLAGLALWMASAVAIADDKDLLKKGAAPANMMIVFGNSQTTEQPILATASAWDGDADSPTSKMGAAKRVVRQFISAKHTTFNIGMTTFAHNPNAGSITISGKHWLYSPLTKDFPGELWAEPAGTIERWGLKGEGPCTNLTVPVCTNLSPNINLTGGGIEAGSFFFGSLGTSTAYICLDGTKCNESPANKDNATKRLKVTLTKGKYGDAYMTGGPYTLGDHSMEVTKVYQVKSGTPPIWNDSATAIVNYVPSSTLTSDLFYTAGADAGKEIGFLNDPQSDIDVNANCSGWEFQKSNANTNPLIKVPRDYMWGATCKPPQDSLPCATRLLRPQAKLVAYSQTTGAFTTNDPDNPGYNLTYNPTATTADKYMDGCDSTLMGAVNIGLDVTENQAIMITRNGSQAPIKDLLTNIYAYFNDPGIDGFQNGKRIDDPNKACRVSGVILIYDNFNGCQNDTCSVLTSQILTKLAGIHVKVYVIGLGASASATSNTGVCIAQNTGAILPDGLPAYFPVTSPAGLFQALVDISDLLDEASQTFATAAVSAGQSLGDQMAYFASFSAAKNRSIWDGRLGGYKLDANGNVQVGQFTINDINDPNVGATIPVPSNDPSSLIWNAGANLIQTAGTGATVSSAVLAPGTPISTGSYSDGSNDTVSTIATHYYPGRKIVFSLPKSNPNPTTLPIPAEDTVPENRYDMIFNTGAGWWPSLRALLGPQGSPLDDTDASSTPPVPANSDAAKTLRFIWGDRDAVTGATDASRKYFGQKLGDIFHSSPLLIGGPNDFALFKTNAAGNSFCSINTAKTCTIGGTECTVADGVCQLGQTRGYQTFSKTYQNRRRVLYVGANDGLLHAFEAGVFGRDTTKPSAYDLGTGAELFAFAPRAIMQIYKPLKDAVGAQTKLDEWTVDLSPSAADVFIDASHSGTPVDANRAWHTVLVGGVREGSPLEGTNGVPTWDSQGSYFALDITQPDKLVSGVESPGGLDSKAPDCLDASGTCARAWPTVLWEITDTCDQDVSGSPGSGHPDMGETWAKASMGRVKICASSCGTSSAVNEDHYVAIFGGGFDRERKNRRGNWLYMVDIETGKTLYKVNSGTADLGSGNVTVNFGSIPSEPAALDYNDDGYLDLIYVGDLNGRLWRIDLTELRKLSSPPSLSACDPSGHFNNQLDLAAPLTAGDPTGSAWGKPFLFFQAGPQTLPNATAFYPIYFRPEAINLGYNSGGRPALGIAFGTGDRDDILGTVDSSSLTYPQRFYYVVDAANNATRMEIDLHPIPSSIAPVASADPKLVNGWFLQLSNGERVVGDALALGGVISFPTYNPISSAPGGSTCANTVKCASPAGTSRLYQVFYTNGNAIGIVIGENCSPDGTLKKATDGTCLVCSVGKWILNPDQNVCPALDRGQTQISAMFITAVTAYVAGSGGSVGSSQSGGAGSAHGLFWSGGFGNPPLGVGRKITVRSWKEKSSRP